jgi:hypothetical protein
MAVIALSLLISTAIALATMLAVIKLLRRQRRHFESMLADFSTQNVTMARQLTEIMLGQQKKQEAQDQAIEKVAGYAVKIRHDINTLAEHMADDDETATPPTAETKWLN